MSETPAEALDRACHLFLTYPGLAPMRAWWEAEALRGALPPGPVDPLRLAMAQGDRERLLMVMQRANRHDHTTKRRT